MLIVYFTIGLPASGKSTWAKKRVDKSPNAIKRVSQGEISVMLDNSYASKHNEQFALAVQDLIIKESLINGKHVIVDNLNLDAKHELRVRELIQDLAVLEVVDFRDVPLETCIKRDLQRPNSVGEKVIRKLYDQFIAAPRATKPIYKPELTDAIICDLDGTLALIVDRSPYDGSRCEGDMVNEPVRSILQNSGKKILLVSGREDQYKPQTLAWLRKHQIDFEGLYMRRSGDTRKDSIVKREIYDQFILDQYNVAFVLDDRDQVVRVWRDLGLTCLQVEYGDF
ncbi:phosphatase domain-containing protein [Pseudanabaena mucicola]|uniref:AAA family ATPase n=1 Tax=Pseudanabaena mucicola FACHB-723 TaxID=2692860 RepID=A0ABR7ZYQ8_9CYAN|nr:AAA family ATPase [Pseudanabaena mucicola]MBD2189146.1 AAA family ATPase [Pseudanabaena mucicola FACHB-723]